MSEIELSTSGRPSFDGLIDTLDRLIGNGAAIVGDVVIALDGVELIRLDLRLLLTGIQGQPAGQPAPAPSRAG
jgi:hypothetical protein